jgi:hypothetical protein
MERSADAHEGVIAFLEKRPPLRDAPEHGHAADP